MSARLLAIAAIASCLLANVASAQPWSGDAKRTATAQALFDEARELMKSGDFARACPKLEEAVKLEPNGVGGKLKLAECYEGAGKLASAFALYSVVEAAARAANQNDRAVWARDRGAALRPRVPVLIIDVNEALGDVADFVVLRDGIEVGRAQWGVPIPVDGGNVEVVASATGHVSFKATATLKNESDSARVTVPALAEVPAMVSREPVKEPLPAKRVVTPPPDEIEPRAGEVPTWAWVTGGTGVGVALLGAAFRIDAAVVEADQVDHCGPGRDQCPRSYDVVGTNDRKELDFNLFVGFTVVGAAAFTAGLVGGIVGATGKRDKKPSVTLWVGSPAGGAQLGAEGVFQ